jgi:Sigma-70 region 2
LDCRDGGAPRSEYHPKEIHTALRSAFHARADTSSAAPTVQDEAKMIASIVEGDTAAFHDLIRPESLVYRVAVRFLRNGIDAEDVVQEFMGFIPEQGLED